MHRSQLDLVQEPAGRYCVGSARQTVAGALVVPDARDPDPLTRVQEVGELVVRGFERRPMR